MHHPRRIHRAVRLGASGLACVAMLTAFGARVTAQEPGTERINRTFDLGSSGRLELSNVAGEIVVTTVSGSTLTIDAVKRVRPRGNESTAEALASLTVEFDQRGDRLEVRTEHSRGRGRQRASVDYTVSVPAGTSVSLHSVSGDLEVTGVQGELRTETVSGQVRIRSAGALSVAKSVSGDVRIETARATNTAEIGSVSGDIVAEDLEAERLEVETVSGEIELRRVASERVELSTVSGDLDFEGPLAPNGRYDLQSHSGDLVLRLSSDDVGFELTAETFSGSIETDVPLTLRGGTGARDDRGRGRRGQSMRGTYGDGSARIEVRTFSGDLEILQR